MHHTFTQLLIKAATGMNRRQNQQRRGQHPTNAGGPDFFSGMLSTGFFFSAAAADPDGFAAAAPEAAPLLSCVFMNHFLMSDDCAPRKQSKNRSVVGSQQQGEKNQEPARQANLPGGRNTNRGARERKREMARTHSPSPTRQRTDLQGPGDRKAGGFSRILGAVRLMWGAGGLFFLPATNPILARALAPLPTAYRTRWRGEGWGEETGDGEGEGEGDAAAVCGGRLASPDEGGQRRAARSRLAGGTRGWGGE